MQHVLFTYLQQHIYSNQPPAYNQVHPLLTFFYIQPLSVVCNFAVFLNLQVGLNPRGALSHSQGLGRG